VLVAASATFAASARADDQSVLVQLLRDSDSFRVRARAALALGRMGDERAVGALEQGLRDPHAAVRAASARALGDVGGRRSVGALRAAAADTAPAVADQAKNALRAIAAREAGGRGAPPEPPEPPAPPRRTLSDARYALVLGEMRDRSPMAGLDLVGTLGERIADELNALGQVVVVAPGEVDGAAASELRRRPLPQFRIEGNLECVDGGVRAGEHAMRCQVSLLLLDEPGRALRSLMRGSASAVDQARGARDRQLQLLAHKTLRAAVRSAMANALQAIEAAAERRELVAGEAEAALDRRPARKRK
jgi:HEAT repeat protein